MDDVSDLQDVHAENETDYGVVKKPFVIGGSRAQFGEFPWVARLYLKEGNGSAFKIESDLPRH